MQIPVLLSQSFEQLSEVGRAIEVINRQQTYFRLSLVTKDWIPDGGKKKWVDQYRLFDEITRRFGEVQYVS